MKKPRIREKETMTPPTLSEKVKEILIDMSSKTFQSQNSPEYRVKIIRETHQSIMEVIRKEVPIGKRAHTYASENADVYRAYDGGFEDCRKEILRRLK